MFTHRELCGIGRGHFKALSQNLLGEAAKTNRGMRVTVFWTPLKYEDGTQVINSTTVSNSLAILTNSDK
jgi:hypothetical protein